MDSEAHVLSALAGPPPGSLAQDAGPGIGQEAGPRVQNCNEKTVATVNNLKTAWFLTDLTPATLSAVMKQVTKGTKLDPPRTLGAGLKGEQEAETLKRCWRDIRPGEMG